MKNYFKSFETRVASRVIIFLGLTAFSSSLFGQIGFPPLPAPELLFETQSQIDEFVNQLENEILVTNIRVLDNGTDPITNLDGLSSLQIVLGDLTIVNNPQLDRFCGLYQLLAVDGALLGAYNVSGNLENPTKVEIIEDGECTEPDEEILTVDEIVLTLLEDGVLKKGQANSLMKQAEKNLHGLSGHLKALTKAGILTEDEAMMIYNAALLEFDSEA